LTRSLAAARRSGRPSWINRGDIVVVKVRSYLADRGDLICRPTNDEYNALPLLPPMVDCDPVKMLPPELVFRIFDFVPLADRINLEEVGGLWRIVFAAFRAHRLRLLSDKIAESAENAAVVSPKKDEFDEL